MKIGPFIPSDKTRKSQVCVLRLAIERCNDKGGANTSEAEAIAWLEEMLELQEREILKTSSDVLKWANIHPLSRTGPQRNEI